ncbi:MAG: transglutaminase family protein [Cyanobacteriota bacterium]|nr:transglutaminase family protein [Cyanobacteriota bacterium]
MDEYLQATDIIDWQHPQILELAQQLARGRDDPEAIAKVCFEWVRDRIRHSCDYQMNPVTCKASEVLEFGTGFCFAKSHLLAALLRANSIPTGFCYQRLSIDDRGAPYSFHGFNAVYLPDFGWYRIDARGNKKGVNAQFSPPTRQLAYTPCLSGEFEFDRIFAAPLPVIIEALQTYSTWNEMLEHLPDIFSEDKSDRIWKNSQEIVEN